MDNKTTNQLNKGNGMKNCKSIDSILDSCKKEVESIKEAIVDLGTHTPDDEVMNLVQENIIDSRCSKLASNLISIGYLIKEIRREYLPPKKI